MNPDFVEMLSALSGAEAEFLVVGAHAMSAHGRPRATGDLDLWVRPSEENAKRVWKALERFGAPLERLQLQDLSTPGIVFQIGVIPSRIDVLTSIDGVDFDEAWTNRIEIEIEGALVAVIGRNELIRNKKAVGRPRDLADIEEIEGMQG